MVILKKIALFIFLCLPAHQAAASGFPLNINGWKLAALVPACATVYYATLWHEAHVLGGYLNHLKKEAPQAFCQIPYAEKKRKILPLAGLLNAGCAMACATVTVLLYSIGILRQ